MSGVMGRLKRRFFVAILAVLSAMPLCAQGGPVRSDDSYVWVPWMLAALTIGYFVWKILKGRNQKARQTDSSARRDSVQSPNTIPASRPAPAANPREATKSIFISYRRQDSAHITGRIYDQLTAKFGKEAVFKDVDSLPLGFDFRDHIREQVSRCSVLVAVIGKNWSGASASGGQRLSDQRDHLRIEIETALERHIPVIPVLVDGVEMPAENELPPPLARLAYHNGISVRPDPDFHNDADRLARGIESLLK
jgi:TIR domain